MIRNTEHRIKQGDTLPALTATLLYATGAKVDLTGAVVRFLMRPRFAATPPVPIVNRPAVVTDTVGGRVRYQWETGDTDESGDYAAEFEVTFPGPRKMTFPNDGFITVRVLADIA